MYTVYRRVHTGVDVAAGSRVWGSHATKFNNKTHSKHNLKIIVCGGEFTSGRGEEGKIIVQSSLCNIYTKRSFFWVSCK